MSGLQRLLPRRIDRYILGEILGPFLGGALFFSFIFLMFQVLRLAELFIVHGVSVRVLLSVVGLMLMSFLPMVLPVAFLIGVLAAFGRLSTDSELVAMKANGIGLWRMAMPAASLGLVVALFSLALNLDWVPRGDRELRSTLARISNSKAVAAVKEGTFTSGFFGLLLYADRVDPVTHRMHGVFIYNDRDKANPHTIVAEEGEIVALKTESEFDASIVMRLYRGSIHRSAATEAVYQKIDFREDRILLEMKEDQRKVGKRPRALPLDELLAQLKRIKAKKRWMREIKAELSRRIAIAISPLLFVFLGMGFGVSRGARNARASAALVAFMVTVAYWVLQTSCTGLAHKGYINPYLALQIPNLVVLFFAVRSFREANW